MHALTVADPGAEDGLRCDADGDADGEGRR